MQPDDRPPAAGDPLGGFSPLTRAWFEATFATPTPAQAGGWPPIGERRDVLVVAPTGSGKTLAAFLSAIDRLAAAPPVPARDRLRVLYVSPLKALAADIERNLRSPLAGLRAAAAGAGAPLPETSVAMRTGDTPADERRRFARTPPDILITTPESLFLLLTSQAREALAAVDTVIVDEVHSLVATKRGAHLALSLERLDQLRGYGRPRAQRIGLSATVRPLEEAARFLGGHAPAGPTPGTGTEPGRPAGHGGGAAGRQGVRAVGGGPGRGHGGDRGGDRRAAARLRGRRPRPREHLAAHRRAPGRAGPRAPLDDRVRQLPPARRARLRPPQRARRRRARAGPPRLGQPRAAQRHRGGPQGRPPPGGRGDQLAGAGHRHGRGRPGRPGRVAPLGRGRAAAHRPRRAPGRRGQPRGRPAQVPRRPGGVRGGDRAHARRRDRGAALPAQPAGRPRPAGGR